MHRGAWFFLVMVWPVRADFLKVELTVSFFPPPVFSSNSQLDGAANFYLDINGPQTANSPAPVVFLDPWERSITAVEDASLFDPCILDGSCGVDTSVRGTAQGFAVFAFPDTVDLPSVQPDVAPIIPVGTLAATDPCRQHLGDPCTQSGPLVAFVAGPVAVGTWEIRMNVVPEPNGMVLFGTAILFLAAVLHRAAQAKLLGKVRRI
ncbi:MAG TPA: hypothetical protein VJN43_11120 [Bryobacteraceae bacterium]|nr:hypothetical protein [Bryobacteraceae bacterium]